MTRTLTFVSQYNYVKQSLHWDRMCKTIFFFYLFVPLFVLLLCGFGDTPLFRPNTGDRFGERFIG